MDYSSQQILEIAGSKLNLIAALLNQLHLTNQEIYTQIMIEIYLDLTIRGTPGQIYLILQHFFGARYYRYQIVKYLY